MTDQDLLTQVQYALLEPVQDGGATWLSEVWTRAEVLDNLNSNVWALLRDTHAIVTYTTIPQAAVALGVVPLPADWMATIGALWIDGNGVYTPLAPVDRFEGDLALPTWETTAGTPIAYNEQEADTLTLQLVPINATDGTLAFLYVARPAAVTGAGATLPLPNELLGGVKYGLLGMLLRSVGRLVDVERGAYCQRRYDLAVEVTKILLSGWA